MTKEELDQKERETFLAWRTHILELEKNEHLLLTPFERNLEMWRQLWRVVERSDLVVTVCLPSSFLAHSEDCRCAQSFIIPLSRFGAVGCELGKQGNSLTRQ